MTSIPKRLLLGSRWEGAIKRLHFGLTGSKNSLYDWQTIEIMRRVMSAADSTGIDIGAFDGAMLRHMFRFAPRGRHVAFEPLPEKFQRLVEAFPGATVYPFALGAVAGPATFRRVTRRPAYSGLRRRVDLPKNEPVEEIQVEVETLDRVIPEDRSIAFVKIDVEGGELGVFQGGVQTLRRNRPVVVFECGLGGADSFASSPGEIYDTVTGPIGLAISLLESYLASRKASLTRDAFIDQFLHGRNYYFVAHP